MMTLEELIGEGRRLQRACVFLKGDGTGDPVAVWHHEFVRTRAEGDFEPWFSVDTRFIPGFDPAQARFVTICTSNEDETGRIDALPALPSGLPLYAHAAAVLPSIEAIFALGGEKVAAWLQANRWERSQRYSSGFPDRALVEAYGRQWVDEHPILGRHADLYAALGGWHLPGADDDWFDLIDERLLAVTVKDSEPWVEAWQKPAGDLHVIQRIM